MWLFNWASLVVSCPSATALGKTWKQGKVHTQAQTILFYRTTRWKQHLNIQQFQQNYQKRQLTKGKLRTSSVIESCNHSWAWHLRYLEDNESGKTCATGKRFAWINLQHIIEGDFLNLILKVGFGRFWISSGIEFHTSTTRYLMVHCIRSACKRGIYNKFWLWVDLVAHVLTYQKISWRSWTQRIVHIVDTIFYHFFTTEVFFYWAKTKNKSII